MQIYQQHYPTVKFREMRQSHLLWVNPRHYVIKAKVVSWLQIYFWRFCRAVQLVDLSRCGNNPWEHERHDITVLNILMHSEPDLKVWFSDWRTSIIIPLINTTMCNIHNPCDVCIRNELEGIWYIVRSCSQCLSVKQWISWQRVSTDILCLTLTWRGSYLSNMNLIQIVNKVLLQNLNIPDGKIHDVTTIMPTLVALVSIMGLVVETHFGHVQHMYSAGC